ncbi:hypothetical protein ACH9L7_15745 [Haloferax sp. S1W]|uniref:hypothetical protein n=1 Tax=Haloferax sp. S1W TaxID=3377110 RepID=UPI0037CBD668
MKDTPMRRLAGILLLMGFLVALMVAFGALSPNPAVGAYPEGEHLDANYNAWVGEKAALWGTVVETDPLVIEDEYGAGKSVHVELTDTSIDVPLGDRIAVYGVVEPDHTIRVLNAYPIPATNYLYMYAVSFLAGLWVLTRLVRTWRLDTQTWALEPRPNPRSWTQHLRESLTESQGSPTESRGSPRESRSSSTESRDTPTEGDDA